MTTSSHLLQKFVACGLAVVLALGGLVSESFGQPRTTFSRPYTPPPVYRPDPPRPMMPAPRPMTPTPMPAAAPRPLPMPTAPKPLPQTGPTVRSPTPLPGSSSRPPTPQQSGSTARALPAKMATAPIAQVPSFTGRITTRGAPIVVTKAGSTFSVPEKGVFSTKIVQRFQYVRMTLTRTSATGQVLILQTRITKYAQAPKLVTTMVASTGGSKGGGNGGGGNTGSGGMGGISNAFNAKSIAPKIAAGHGYQKHVIEKRNVPSFIKTREDYARHIEKVMLNPSAQRKLRNGRTAYWDEESKFVVITAPGDKKGDYGTAFSPEKGREYFENELE